MALKYQRILLKISGEALGGEKGTGFDEPTMDAICGGVKKAHELGVQIGIVVGGGNFWRGRSSGKMERTLADKIGMLATVMNALAVSDKLEQLGVPTEVFTSITMPQVAPAFTRKDALHAMEEGKIAIFGGGTGNPFFSTDTTTALRAVEVSADIMFKATMVDGVYDKDPHKYPDAKKYETLTFTKVLEDRLAVMDGTAATLCRDNKLPILVFDLADPDNIARAVQGENVPDAFSRLVRIDNKQETRTMSSNTKAFEDKMKSAVEHLERELKTVRAGRANPGVLDKVTVDYYGSPTPIQQVASVAVSEARTLTITPWDRTLLRAISKAILASDVGINPIDDGQTIRLNFPAPTEERRKQLAKEVSKMGEEAKVAVRNVRRDAMDKAKAMKKAGELTEDTQKTMEEDVQKLTDKYVKNIDAAVEEKQKEIMSV